VIGPSIERVILLSWPPRQRWSGRSAVPDTGSIVRFRRISSTAVQARGRSGRPDFRTTWLAPQPGAPSSRPWDPSGLEKLGWDRLFELFHERAWNNRGRLIIGGSKWNPAPGGTVAVRARRAGHPEGVRIAGSPERQSIRA